MLYLLYKVGISERQRINKYEQVKPRTSKILAIEYSNVCLAIHNSLILDKVLERPVWIRSLYFCQIYVGLAQYKRSLREVREEVFQCQYELN